MPTASPTRKRVIIVVVVMGGCNTTLDSPRAEGRIGALSSRKDRQP
jgi:hypothetical protein